MIAKEHRGSRRFHRDTQSFYHFKGSFSFVSIYIICKYGKEGCSNIMNATVRYDLSDFEQDSKPDFHNLADSSF